MAGLIDATVPTTYRYVAMLYDMQILEEGRAGTYHPTARIMPVAREAEGFKDVPRPLQEQMSGMEDAWAEIAARHVLVEADLTRLASWWHFGQRPREEH
jgi:DNA-binding IclR family transcriptional regulator